jgi:hypothetical protein
VCLEPALEGIQQRAGTLRSVKKVQVVGQAAVKGLRLPSRDHVPSIREGKREED